MIYVIFMGLTHDIAQQFAPNNFDETSTATIGYGFDNDDDDFSTNQRCEFTCRERGLSKLFRLPHLVQHIATALNLCKQKQLFTLQSNSWCNRNALRVLFTDLYLNRISRQHRPIAYFAHKKVES